MINIIIYYIISLTEGDFMIKLISILNLIITLFQ